MEKRLNTSMREVFIKKLREDDAFFESMRRYAKSRHEFDIEKMVQEGHADKQLPMIKDADACEHENDSGDDPFVLDKNMTFYHYVYPKQLEFWLTTLEPVTFSRANLNSCRTPGQKSCSKEILMQLLEACVRRTSETSISKEERRNGALTKLHCEEYLALGSPCHELQLGPGGPKWETQGWYRTVVSVKNGAALLVNLRKESVDITLLLHSHSIVSAKGLICDFNWSELRAVLKSSSGKVIGLCKSIMDGTGPTPSSCAAAATPSDICTMTRGHDMSGVRGLGEASSSGSKRATLKPPTIQLISPPGPTKRIMVKSPEIVFSPNLNQNWEVGLEDKYPPSKRNKVVE